MHSSQSGTETIRLKATPSGLIAMSLLRLQRFGHWLLDAAATSLGFAAPADHPAPPLVGVQPYSAIPDRQRPRLRLSRSAAQL